MRHFEFDRGGLLAGGERQPLDHVVYGIAHQRKYPSQTGLTQRDFHHPPPPSPDVAIADERAPADKQPEHAVHHHRFREAIGLIGEDQRGVLQLAFTGG